MTLIPPLLALADETDASGQDVIAAYASEFETECAVARPICPDHYEEGWHATATFGIFCAAMAAAKLLNLDAGGLSARSTSLLRCLLGTSCPVERRTVSGWSRLFTVSRPRMWDRSLRRCSSWR